MSKLKVLIDAVIELLDYRKTHIQKFHLIWFISYLKDFPLSASDKKSCESYVPTILAQADKMHDRKKHLEAYDLLDHLPHKEPNVLWRMARALYFVSTNESICKESRIRLIDKARNVLDKAIMFGGENNAEVQKWMGIVIDQQVGFVNLESRIKIYPLVKNYLQKACELNPKDFSAYYILGKWHYQICKLNWFQRKIAKYLLSCDIPAGNQEEAYKYLSHAEKLHPRLMVSNLYFLGDICVKLGHYFKARYYLNLAIGMRPRNDEEKKFQLKSKRLLVNLDRFDSYEKNTFYDPFMFLEICS